MEFGNFMLGWHIMCIKNIFSKWRGYLSKPFAEGTSYKFHEWCSHVACKLGRASLSMKSDWFVDALIDQVAHVVCIIKVITVPLPSDSDIVILHTDTNTVYLHVYKLSQGMTVGKPLSEITYSSFQCFLKCQDEVWIVICFTYFLKITQHFGLHFPVIFFILSKCRL